MRGGWKDKDGKDRTSKGKSGAPTKGNNYVEGQMKKKSEADAETAQFEKCVAVLVPLLVPVDHNISAAVKLQAILKKRGAPEMGVASTLGHRVLVWWNWCPIHMPVKKL